MNLKPSEKLSNQQVRTGMRHVINDGIASEAMTTFTSGAFLTALALRLGASNFQIGLLAALPTFTNILQVISIYLVQRYNNRRAVVVISNFLARSPLFIIGILPFLFSTGTSIQVLIFLLFFHYAFGSIAGPSWNAWMKDLIPQGELGSYFSHRGRIMQILNVVMSLVLAMVLDFVKAHHPAFEVPAYAIMSLLGGIAGMLGVWFMAKTPEQAAIMAKENLFKLFWKPLREKNFRSLLIFQSFWTFSLNLATPFFSVYMMQTLGLSLSYIIAFAIITQVSSILFIKMWGRSSDRFSNKTIIRIAAPLYIITILSWCFIPVHATRHIVLLFLLVINILSGMTTAGINLAIDNIGIKLASQKEAVAYFSTKNVVVAIISAIGPIVGGLLADFFAHRQLNWNIQYQGPHGVAVIPMLNLQSWSFLFLIGGLLAFFSLKLLSAVKEEGEVHRHVAVAQMRVVFKRYPGMLRKSIGRRVITMKRSRELARNTA